MTRRTYRYGRAALVLLALLTAGCSDVKDTLGLTQKSPDEFTIVDGAPLSVPPDFALRPPQPGAPPRAQQTAASERAAATLFGTEGLRSMPQFGGNAAASPGEQSLLHQIKAVPSDSGIRALIDRESGDRVVSNPKLIQDLLFWKKDEPPATATTVDAAAERKRIADDQAAGKPLTTGDTPIITKGKASTLGDWF